MKSTRTLLVAASIVSVALALTACSQSDPAPAPSAAPTTAAVASGPFGAACSAIPADVAAAAPTVAAADAAGKIPALSTLVSFVGAAGLGQTLNTTPNITIFAPTNDAFAKIDAATVAALQADPTGKLANILKYHVVASDITPDKLVGPFTTLNGAPITIAGSGQTFTVTTTTPGNVSNIVCGN
ncbi:MAG: fasciclin domain-containing protein, partial [Actinobacteria bacterium]|nr:fasciclin domain-containing protein [Actinomycetota bacterium]